MVFAIAVAVDFQLDFFEDVGTGVDRVIHSRYVSEIEE
jgi:hypothetical protein